MIAERRLYRTAFPCARSTTRPTTTTFWASARTTRCTSARKSWTNTTVPCSSTVFRNLTARASLRKVAGCELMAHIILTEDEVIDAVIAHLEKDGWAIESRSHADEHGDDIVAVRSGQKLVIEAKGAGSSKSGSNRYGLAFSKGQVFDHVGKAILKALRVVGQEHTTAGIALPDNEHHRSEIDVSIKSLCQPGER
jgi:hypothetical protein